jgi:hypothetical protein
MSPRHRPYDGRYEAPALQTFRGVKATFVVGEGVDADPVRQVMAYYEVDEPTGQPALIWLHDPWLSAADRKADELMGKP